MDLLFPVSPMPDIRAQIERFPRAPGVYLMKNADGKIVYVGKAKNLRSRVRQYYSQSGDPRFHIRLGLPSVVDIDFLVTNTEKEALILENTLIKKHKPRFNVNLRDDKNHVHLRLDPRETYPRLTVVRRAGTDKDRAQYFGPYASSQAVRETLRGLYRVFPIRSCTDAVFNSRTRPCLYHEIGQCVAPCVEGFTTAQAYRELVQQVVLHLQGKSDELVKTLKAEIGKASDDLRFEEAGRLYKRLQAVEETMGKQRVNLLKQRDQDIFGYHRAGDTVQIQTLNVRSGQLVGGRSYTFTRQLVPEAEVLSSFINQYYTTNPHVPREVLLPCDLEDADSLAELLSEQKGRQVFVRVPQKGDKQHLVRLAMTNARLSYEKEQDAEEQQQRALEDLQKRLRLQVLPRRIECFDISNISGTQSVGSMVCFTDGQPDKQRYRRYRIRTLEGPNDYGMMLEVLAAALPAGAGGGRPAGPAHGGRRQGATEHGGAHSGGIGTERTGRGGHRQEPSEGGRNERRPLAQRRKVLPSGPQERGYLSEPRAGPVLAAARPRRGAPFCRDLSQEAAQQATAALAPGRDCRGRGETEGATAAAFRQSEAGA